MAEILEEEDEEWSAVDDSLEEVDSERVKEQLNVMVSAEIVYEDEKSTVWYTDLVESYEEMIDAFGGEESIDQYLQIQPQGVKVSVEQEGRELFTVYTVEPGEDRVEEPKLNYETSDYV